MSFSASWLDLREAPDHAARSPALAATLTRHFAGRERVRVVDLGSGTGSNLRATLGLLPAVQEWTLVDLDEALLAAARDRLTRIADTVDTADSAAPPWRFTCAGRSLAVTPRRADLALGLGPVLADGVDLVTASALFDLASAGAIGAMAAEIAATGAAFFTVLTYDGEEHWTPPHAADAAVLAAFNRHMTRDKGLGAAAGAAATAALEAAFTARGYRVTTAPSPWMLTRPADGALIDALAEGIAGAVAETGRVPAESLAAWRAARQAATGVVVGHLDLLALPPG